MARSFSVSAGAGGFVLLGVAALVFLSTQITRNRPTLMRRPTYSVTARFDDIADLQVGAHVAMSGVNVGRVAGIAFDPGAHDAVVEIRFDTAFNRIPTDSSASITTQGILGGKFISLAGGSADSFLADRGVILSTRSAIPLESLVSRLVVRHLKQPGAPLQNGGQAK